MRSTMIIMNRGHWEVKTVTSGVTSSASPRCLVSLITPTMVQVGGSFGSGREFCGESLADGIFFLEEVAHKCLTTTDFGRPHRRAHPVDVPRINGMRNAEKYPGVTEFTRAVGTLALSGLIAGCPSPWIIEIICVSPRSGTVAVAAAEATPGRARSCGTSCSKKAAAVRALILVQGQRYVGGENADRIRAEWR